MNLKIHFSLLISIFTIVNSQAFASNPNVKESEACVVQTCGEATSLPTASAPVTAQDENQYKTEIEPLVNDLIQRELMLQDLRIFLVKKFARMKLDHVSDDVRAMTNYFIAMKYAETAYRAVDIETEGEEKKVKINTDKLKEAFTKANVQEVDWLTESLRVIIESEAYLEYVRWDNQPLEYILKYNYHGKSFTEALVLDAKKYGAVLQSLKTAFPIFATLIDNGELDLVQKILRKEPISTTEKELYLSLRGQAILFKELLTGGSWRNQLLNRKAPVSDDVKQTYENAMKFRKYNYQSWSSFAQSERKVVESQCETSITQALASSPSSQQNEVFKNQVVPKVVAAAGSILSFDEKKIFDSTETIMPKTRDELAQYLKDDLQDEIVRMDRSYKVYLRLNPNLQAHQEVYYLYLSAQEESSKYEVLEKTGEYCDESGPEKIIDSSLAEFNIVRVGWRSVLYPNYGFGILGHELGHILSAAQKKNKRIKNIKACLQENQNKVDQFVEEDFADLFASKLMVQQSGFSNFSCLLIPQSDKKYFDLNFTPHSQDDNHSNGFLRLINVGSYTKSLAPACESVRSSNLATVQWKDCWQ